MRPSIDGTVQRASPIDPVSICPCLEAARAHASTTSGNVGHSRTWGMARCVRLATKRMTRAEGAEHGAAG